MFLYYKHVNVFVILLLCFRYANNASLSIYEQKKYQHLIDGQGLYTADDDVEILTVKNFKSNVYGQKNAWLIEFYNSWCGFCQRFAPSWKALASDIRGWKSRINIGAVDCSDNDNTEICRDFEIMAYPTLRYFHENYVEGPKKLGDEVEKGDDVNSHRKLLIKKMISEQEIGRGRMFPNIQPYSASNLKHLFEGVSLNTKYIFLIFENGTTLGPEVAFDLQDVPEIAVRYSYITNTDLLQNLHVSKVPFMIVLSDDNKSKQFSEGITTRDGIKQVIKQFLDPKHIAIPDKQKADIYTGKWLDATVPDISSLVEAREKKALREKIKKMGDVVFQMDLETALRYSLKHEVANIKTISGEKRNALLDYLSVLIKFFPLSQNGRTFLMQLENIIKSSDNVKGSDISSLMQIAENENQRIYSSPQQWLACEGSTPEVRGYPCGLWKMFHYLVVNAAEKHNRDPKEVLKAMHGYIKNFFGCADCSKHFQEMAKRNNMDGVDSLESSIIWLWKAHNEVNKRLAGDATEDPEFPKIQFPSVSNCAQCRKPDYTWKYPEVVMYLKNMYSSVNVRYIGSDTSVLHSGLEGPKPAGGTSILRAIDSSMCIILYVTSLFLLIILIRMFLKRGYRKKMYVHDLLGKV